MQSAFLVTVDPDSTSGPIDLGNGHSFVERRRRTIDIREAEFLIFSRSRRAAVTCVLILSSLSRSETTILFNGRLAPALIAELTLPPMGPVPLEALSTNHRPKPGNCFFVFVRSLNRLAE